MSGGSRNVDQGNRIDSRARGNAAQLLEKYRNMARDAQMSGDRVMTEYYLQFADHYFRVLSDARSRQEEQRARFEDRDGDGERGSTASDSTDEAEDMDETLDAIDQIGRAPRNREGRDNRDRDGNRDGNREAGRDGRPRDRDARRDRPERTDRHERSERPERVERDGEMTAAQRDPEPRGSTPREAGQRDAAPRGDREDRPRRPRRERPEREDEAPAGIDIAVLPPAIGIEPLREPAVAEATGEEAAPAPKRRGRPRKVDVASEGEAAPN